MSPRTLALLALAATLTGCPRGPGDDTSDDTADDTGGDDTADDTGTDTSDTSDTGTDTGSPPIDCHVLPAAFPADWAGDIVPKTLITNTPYTDTASGLATLVDTIAALPVNTTSTPDTFVTPITVTEAYVLTTGFKPSAATSEVNFWVADKDDVAYVRLATASSVAVKAGDKVTFTATKGQNFSGDIQVSEINTFSVVSSNNPVYVKESTGATLTVADAFWVHHLYGELTDAGTGCGGSSTCFTFKHGTGGAQTASLRIQNGNLTIPLVKGDCIAVYMPADQHQGGLSFDVTDFAWFKWYGNSGN